MSLSFLVPSRTVLLVADEALYVYACGPKGARLAEAVPWESENFESFVARIIAKDCGGKPVLILSDMVEQHYRKERIMKAGAGLLDKSRVVNHKLRLAFPSYPVRAAYKLNEKAPKGAGKGASDIYIFAALPESRQLTQAVDAARKSLVSISSFGLLPVEATDMVKALYAKLKKKSTLGTQWAVFMGQHRHGGLRQIVIKNGELALTRMSPVIESDKDPKVWASEVFQEFNATMSYLSRFGFQPEDDLHIISIASSESGDALQKLMEENYSYTNLTSVEAARILGLPLGIQDDYRYADPLHVAWIAKKAKLILPMKSNKLDRISGPRKSALAVSFLLFCGVAYLGYQLFNESIAYSTVNTDIRDSKDKLGQLEVQYQKEVKKSEAMGINIRLVQSAIEVYSALQKNNIFPLSLYSSVSKALGNNLRLDSIFVGKPKSLMDTTVTPALDGSLPPLYEARMKMTFPATTDIEKGNQQIDSLQNRLQLIMPDTKVEVTKRLKDYEYVREMVVETGQNGLQNNEAATQDFVAEITIKGPPEK